MSFFSLILNASLLVQLVMLILLVASVFSWTAIFDRYKILKEAKEESETFESRFWSGGDLGELYRRLEKDPTLEGQSAIFVAGFKEYARLREHEAEPMAIVEGLVQVACVTTEMKPARIPSSIKELLNTA
jgi:biopolymer transport protein TolQ